MDCGVAPGMPNYIVGYHNERMKINEIEYMVGGLPKIRTLPFEYKAPFSPCDVIEEYTRPARYVENGNLVVKPAMSDAEYVHFDKIGTLEAFNTDGLTIADLHYEAYSLYERKNPPVSRGIFNLSRLYMAAGFLDREPLA